MTLLATLGTVLFVAYLGLVLCFGGVLLFLHTQGRLTRPNLALGYALPGSAAIGLCVLASVGHAPDSTAYLALGVLGIALLATPGIIVAFLLARKTLPPALKALARPVLVGAVFATITLGYAVPLAAQARRDMAYNNPNEGAVRAALATNPNDPAAQMSLAHIDILHGDYADATTQLQEVTRLEPGNGEAAFLLAHALMRTGHTREAWALYTRIGAQNDSEGWGRAARRYLARRSPSATTSPQAGRAEPRR